MPLDDGLDFSGLDIDFGELEVGPKKENPDDNEETNEDENTSEDSNNPNGSNEINSGTDPEDGGNDTNNEDEFDGDGDEDFTELVDNKLVVWDDFEENIFFTDGSYRVRYRFSEDAIQLADTGIDLDYVAIGGLSFFVLGIVLFTSSRKRKLMDSDTSLEDIYKNAYKLKIKIEKLIKEKVEINIDINKFAPYAKNFNSYENDIQDLNSELQYTLVAIKNIKTICEKNNEEFTKDLLQERLKLISKNFEINYTGNNLEQSESVKITEQKDTKKIKRKFFERKQLRRPVMGLAVLSILMGMSFGIYATQQMYLSNLQQDNAQDYLEKLYLGEETISTEKPNNLYKPLRIFQSDNPVFDIFEDFTSIDQSSKIEEYQPSVLGLLEIPNTNISQYVVSGTDDQSLQFGPGHYLGTSLPGSGGNVGIAGHRTTYGAPFSRLDSVQIGDEMYLTVGSNKYHYVVDEIEIVDPVTGEYVLYDRGDDRLTLTTCHPRYSARQRLVVSGFLTKIESGN
tara:strand:+ start:1 stop:1530 length:1530 start_codon:yes stop_codon:yes gene_type:complete